MTSQFTHTHVRSHDGSVLLFCTSLYQRRLDQSDSLIAATALSTYETAAAIAFADLTEDNPQFDEVTFDEGKNLNAP